MIIRSTVVVACLLGTGLGQLHPAKTVAAAVTADPTAIRSAAWRVDRQPVTSTSTVRTGETIRVSATGFRPHDKVTVRLTGVASTSIRQADDAGRLTYSYLIPQAGRGPHRLMMQAPTGPPTSNTQGNVVTVVPAFAILAFSVG